LDQLDAQHGSTHLVNVMFGVSEMREPLSVQGTFGDYSDSKIIIV